MLYVREGAYVYVCVYMCSRMPASIELSIKLVVCLYMCMYLHVSSSAYINMCISFFKLHVSACIMYVCHFFACIWYVSCMYVYVLHVLAQTSTLTVTTWQNHHLPSCNILFATSYLQHLILVCLLHPTHSWFNLLKSPFRVKNGLT